MLLEVQFGQNLTRFVVVGDTMYIFGGYNEGNCHNDIYAFDLVLHHWKRIEPEIGIVPGNESRSIFSSIDRE